MWKICCQQKLWQNIWFENQKCQVPFMFFGNHMISNKSYPICDKTLSLKAIKSWKSMPADDSCPKYQPCNQNKYTFTKDELNTSEAMEPAFTFSLSYKDRSVEIHKSFVSYKFENFIAEFGGFLGMFLGLSCFSFIEFLSSLFHKI